MRNLLLISLMVILLAVATFTCKPAEEREEPVAPQKSELNVLTSFLPIYIFTLNVVKGAEGVKVDVLVPPDLVGPHGYEPSPSDMKKIDKANIFIANGLELETFLKSVKSVKPGLKIVFASDGIETIPDVAPERLWETEGGETGSTGAQNPHVWVSPSRAARMVHNIAEALSDIDLINADKYRSNAEKYAKKLEELGEEYRKTLLFVSKRKIVTIHNAFDYLARDTGFEVVAVLRVDPQAEPRAAELARIAEKMRSEGVAAIFMEPQFPPRLAEVLAKDTGVQVYELDPVATGKPALDLYERVMLKNLENLKMALGGSE